MAHEKVYGICENKCRVEVPTKEDLKVIKWDRENELYWSNVNGVYKTAGGGVIYCGLEGYEILGITGIKSSSVSIIYNAYIENINGIDAIMFIYNNIGFGTNNPTKDTVTFSVLYRKL